MKFKIKQLSVIIAAILVMSSAGCGSVSDSGMTSSESTSLEVSSSVVSVPDINITDMSIPDVSLPDMSIPDVSVPSFDFSSSAFSGASEVSSDYMSDISSEPESSVILSDPAATQTIGDSEMGYLDIPADFLRFEDVAGNADLQYSDKSATTIFTLNTLGDEDPDSLDLEAGAQALAKDLQDKGAQGLTGARVTVAGKYEAIQVYGYWPEDDTFLVVDLFKTSKRGIYLAVEFPSDNAEIVKYLDTYRE